MLLLQTDERSIADRLPFGPMGRKAAGHPALCR
jgi:hypothetical protein